MIYQKLEERTAVGEMRNYIPQLEPPLPIVRSPLKDRFDTSSDYVQNSGHGESWWYEHEEEAELGGQFGVLEKGR